MRNPSSLTRGAAIGLPLAIALAGAAEARTPPRKPAPAAPSALEQKVDALTAQVGALERRLDEEARARQATEAQASAAAAEAVAARADAQAARAQLAQQIETLPASIESAAEASAGRNNILRNRGVSLTFGGFLAAEVIYRSRNEASDISSSFNRIPFDNAAIAHTQELRASARQSRLSFLVQGDVSRSLTTAFYGEFDFQGGAQTANSNESNSYNPRIRHLYGTLDWSGSGLHLLAGQSWSLVTLNTKGITPRNELPPPAIDGQFVPGFAWARQPQVRLVKDWNKTVWAAVSLENPQTTFAAPATGIAGTAAGVSVTTSQAGISGFDSANSLSLNHLPDIVGKVAFEPQIGEGRPLHFEAFGLWRSYYARVNAAPGNALGLSPGTFDSNVSGGGIGGSVVAAVVPKFLDLQVSVMTGRGIGRYGSAQLPDVTLAPDGTVAPIRETMVLVGATVHATPSLDIYVFGGRERQDDKFFDVAGGHFGYGNPAATFTMAGCTTEGGICAPNLRQVDQITAGVWQKVYTGPYGQVRVGVQYSHTRLTGFPGVGGFVPTTSDDMVFTSFRYYPPAPN